MNKKNRKEFSKVMTQFIAAIYAVCGVFTIFFSGVWAFASWETGNTDVLLPVVLPLALAGLGSIYLQVRLYEVGEKK